MTSIAPMLRLPSAGLAAGEAWRRMACTSSAWVSLQRAFSASAASPGGKRACSLAAFLRAHPLSPCTTCVATLHGLGADAAVSLGSAADSPLLIQLPARAWGATATLANDAVAAAAGRQMGAKGC